MSESQQNVRVTDRAFDQIAKILDSEAAGAMLRVSVLGGGCSGFQYHYEIVQDATDADLVIARDATRVLVDDVSLPFLEGSEIDWVDDLIGAAFQINNPNATANCGCGTSFSI